ncbi:MAG: low molecular weight protein-tyrosine-phosphatase [Chlamydiota bacterium]
MVRVMFVCLGNICRSPAGEGMLQYLAKKFRCPVNLEIESSGIGDWHVGQLPDSRMREAALKRGITLVSRAQAFKTDHFDMFDFVLAADHEVMNDLYRYARSPLDKSKIHLITAFGTTYRGEEIPDPYYGGARDFDLVLDMLEDSCEGFLQEFI